MATKITDLTELAVAPASDDVLHIIDVGDTSGGAAGTSKKIQVSNLTGGEYFTVNGAAILAQTAEMALPFVELTENTNFLYYTTFAIPKNCRLVSVTSASASDGGATDLSAYKPTSDAAVSTFTALGTVQVASHTATGTHTFTFDSATYDYVVGDRFGLTVSSVTNLNNFRFTCLFKTI